MTGGKCGSSTATAVWRQLTAEEGEDGLVAVYVLAVRWWLEGSWLMVARLVVKMVCHSIGSS